MPYLPPNHLVDVDAELPQAAGESFWMDGFAWEMPDYDNVETFVERLVRENVLVTDPVIKATLDNRPQDLSERTLRRRFLQATGLTQGTIQQIERAKQAAALLENGVPILDVVFEAGYADQPHLTRSLRRFFGTTPAQIAQVPQLA
jgi:AraC-like DNA-binding protein